MLELPAPELSVFSLTMTAESRFNVTGDTLYPNVYVFAVDVAADALMVFL